MAVENNAKTTGGVTGKGFAPKTSGNPGGRPKMPTELKEAFKKLGPEALKTLADIMRSSEQDSVRVKAAEVILDRGYGKASQPVEGGLDLQVVHVGLPAFVKANAQD